MQSVARRIVDRNVLRLIKMWLKTPVEERDEEGKRRMSGGRRSTCGTPQGGVVSPTLANVYMNRFLKYWRRSERNSAYLDLPRFRGRLRAWDQAIWSDGILSSRFETFFGLAPGGAILPSRPARWCGRRAQRRSRTAPSWGRPEGLSLTAASTTARWCASGSTAVT